MATFVQMQNRVYYVLRDVERAFVTLQSVKDWLNEGYLDLVARLRLNDTTLLGDTSSTGNVALPTDFIYAKYLGVTATGATVEAEVQFTTDDIFDSWKEIGDTPPSQIILSRHYEGNFETYPVQVSRPFTLRYIAKPTALSADSDVPVLPEELHIKIINYARAHAKWQEAEEADGNLYYSLYTEGLPSAPTGIQRAIPGPLNFTPPPDYWD